VEHAGRPGEGEFTRLDHGESLRLLASVPVGRLIFTVNALPAVRLMNFALVDGLIVPRNRRQHNRGPQGRWHDRRLRGR
jgi:hypothetical protein